MGHRPAYRVGVALHGPEDRAGPAPSDTAAALVQGVFATLANTHPRSDVSLEEVPAPGRRLAPYGFAVEAELLPQRRGQVLIEAEPLATGRFIVLHDPAGNDDWQGSWRVVTLVSAGVDLDMGRDPLLAEVTWTWLVDALEARSVGYRAERGTVTVTASRRFGGAVDDPDSEQDVCEVELRCSWSPLAVEDLPDHLAAFCDLLGALAGAPTPEPAPSIRAV